MKWFPESKRLNELFGMSQLIFVTALMSSQLAGGATAEPVASPKEAEAKWQTVAEESFETPGTWNSKDNNCGWRAPARGAAKIEIVDDNYPGTRGGKSMKMTQTGDFKSKSIANIRLLLPWKNPKAIKEVRVSFHWKMDAKAGGWDFLTHAYYPKLEKKLCAGARLSLRDIDSRVAEDRNFLCAIRPGFGRIPCCILPPDTWNEATVVFKQPFEKYTLYVRPAKGKVQIFKDLPYANGKRLKGMPPTYFLLGVYHFKITGSLIIDDFKVEVLSPDKESFPGLCNPPPVRETSAAFTTKPPVIDGKLNDKVWQSAKAAADFQGWLNSKATRQTRGMLAYDYEKLYVAIENFESDMKSIKARTNAPIERDRASWADDLNEFFLQLGPGSNDYVQFAISAGGASWEFSSQNRKGFNPEWKWAAGRSPNGWTVEMAIPWKELASETGELHWPPVANELWGVNFHRYAIAAKETTLWNPMSRHRGFHSTMNMGLVKFLPPVSSPYVSAIEALPEAGKGCLKVRCANPGSAKTKISMRIKEESSGKKLLGQTDGVLSSGAQAVLELPAPLTTGTKWNALVNYASKTIFSLKGQAHESETRRLLAKLSGMLVNIGAALNTLDKLPASRQAGLAERLTTFRNKLESTLKLLHKKNLNFDDRIRIAETEAALSNDIEFRGLLTLVDKIARDNEAWKRKYIISEASSMSVIRPEAVFPGNASKGVDLSLAGNEARSFLIQVTAPWEELKNVQVKVEKELPGISTTIRQVGYIHCPNTRFSVNGAGPDNLWFPDPLALNKPFTLKKGTSLTLLVTVDVPSGVAPGNYAGSIIVEPEGKTAATIPLKTRVWDFALPEVPTLRAWTWFFFFGPIDLKNLNNLEAFYKEFSRYRIGFDPGSIFNKGDMVKIFKNKDGSYLFDFSKLNRYHEIAYRYGTRSFNLAMNCHDALRCLFLGEYKPVKVTLPDGSIETLNLKDPKMSKLELQKAPFMEPMRSLYEPMLKAAVKNWKDKGWYKYAHFEAIDEPASAIDDVYIEVYRKRKEIVPDLPLMSFGVGSGSNKAGINTVWAPNLNGLTNCLKFMHERKTKGDTLFSYICCGITWNQNRNSPDVYAWEPPVDRRVIGWMSWKWGLDGFFFFTANFGWKWRFNKIAKHENWNPWPYKNSNTRQSPEIANFLYYEQKAPGKYVCIPSLRLDNWRDGIEDYEYLHLVDTMRKRLAEYTGKINEAKRKELLDQAKSLLDLESLVPGEDIFSWDRNPEAYEKRRLAMGKWLDTVSKILKKK